MDRAHHQEKLITFLSTVAVPGVSVSELTGGITTGTGGHDLNLVQAGVIDSFAIIQIISYLEQNYGLNLHKAGISPAELVSIGGIMTAIERSTR